VGQVGEERGLGEFGRSRVYGVVGAAVWCVEADVREIEDCESSFCKIEGPERNAAESSSCTNKFFWLDVAPSQT